MAATRARVAEYVSKWRGMGYPEDIPDEVPDELMNLGLAPSYKAIALAILNGDIGLHGLGFSPPRSRWYDEIKRIEIAARKSA